MNTELITEKLAAVQSLRIGVIGDLMLDTYTYGRVERISPEAPIPILQIESEMAVLGGAGNVYANLVTLGVNTIMMGSVGADTLGIKLIDLLLADTGKAVPHHIVVDRNKPTINKQRIVAGTQQLLRIDTEDTAALDDALTDTLIAGIPVYFAGVTAICKGPQEWLQNFNRLLGDPDFAHNEIIGGQNYLRENHTRATLLNKWDLAVESVMS